MSEFRRLILRGLATIILYSAIVLWVSDCVSKGSSVASCLMLVR